MSLFMMILFGGVVYFVAKVAVTHAQLKTRRAQLDERMHQMGFPMDEYLTGVDAFSAIATNTKKNRFLLGRIEKNHKATAKRIVAADILAIGLIEDGRVLEEVQRGKGQVHPNRSRIQKPLSPYQARVAERLGMSKREFAQMVTPKSTKVHAIELAIVLQEQGEASYENPWLLSFLSKEHANDVVQRKSRRHQHFLKKAFSWFNALERAMDASAGQTKTKEPIIRDPRRRSIQEEVAPPSNESSEPRASFQAVVAAGSSSRHQENEAFAKTSAPKDEASSQPIKVSEENVAQRAVADVQQRIKQELKDVQRTADATTNEPVSGGASPPRSSAQTAAADARKRTERELRDVRQNIEQRTEASTSADASPAKDGSFESLWEEQRRKAFEHSHDAL